jgi:hypothetical protein
MRAFSEGKRVNRGETFCTRGETAPQLVQSLSKGYGDAKPQMYTPGVYTVLDSILYIRAGALRSVKRGGLPDLKTPRGLDRRCQNQGKTPVATRGENRLDRLQVYPLRAHNSIDHTVSGAHPGSRPDAPAKPLPRTAPAGAL